jgi:hypothetical protein
MPLIVSCAIFAYLMATACAIVIMMRSVNWRIRFLSFAIGLAPLCQTIILLGNQHMWITPNIGRTAESLQLSDSALCLAALHLLNRENRNRKGSDSRLRIAEAHTAENGWIVSGGEPKVAFQEKPAALEMERRLPALAPEQLQAPMQSTRTELLKLNSALSGQWMEDSHTQEEMIRARVIPELVAEPLKIMPLPSMPEGASDVAQNLTS